MGRAGTQAYVQMFKYQKFKFGEFRAANLTDKKTFEKYSIQKVLGWFLSQYYEHKCQSCMIRCVPEAVNFAL